MAGVGVVAGKRPAEGLVSWARRDWVKMARVKARRGILLIPTEYPILWKNRVVILGRKGLCQRNET